MTERIYFEDPTPSEWEWLYDAHGRRLDGAPGPLRHSRCVGKFSDIEYVNMRLACGLNSVIPGSNSHMITAQCGECYLAAVALVQRGLLVRRVPKDPETSDAYFSITLRGMEAMGLSQEVLARCLRMRLMESPEIR